MVKIPLGIRYDLLGICWGSRLSRFTHLQEASQVLHGFKSIYLKYLKNILALEIYL